MKKFSFSLQKLLDYREQMLEAERTILADMNAILNGLIQEREELQQQQTDRSAQLRELTAGGISAMEMETHKNYLTMLDFTIRQKRQQIELQRRAIDQQTDKVREAKIEISTMEKLRERKLEEYNYGVQKAEEQMIEEFVSNARAVANG